MLKPHDGASDNAPQHSAPPTSEQQGTVTSQKTDQAVKNGEFIHFSDLLPEEPISGKKGMNNKTEAKSSKTRPISNYSHG